MHRRGRRTDGVSEIRRSHFGGASREVNNRGANSSSRNCSVRMAIRKGPGSNAAKSAAIIVREWKGGKPRADRAEILGIDQPGSFIDRGGRYREPSFQGLLTKAIQPLTMKTLVLGLGNPIVRDDSIGLRVVAQLRDRLADREGVEVDEDYWGGLRLMERLVGFDRAVVIDAIQTGAEPGTIHILSPSAIPTQRSASAHDVNLPTALAFGRQAGLKLPEDERICLVGIEVVDILTFGDDCTEAVAAALPRAVETVIDVLDGFDV